MPASHVQLRLSCRSALGATCANQCLIPCAIPHAGESQCVEQVWPANTAHPTCHIGLLLLQRQARAVQRCLRTFIRGAEGGKLGLQLGHLWLQIRTRLWGHCAATLARTAGRDNSNSIKAGVGQERRRVLTLLPGGGHRGLLKTGAGPLSSPPQLRRSRRGSRCAAQRWSRLAER